MTTPLNIIFAGTPAFAVSTLQTLLETDHKVIAVYTQPDRPAGRGRKLTASPVKMVAIGENLPVFQPASLRDPAEIEMFNALQADLMVVVAYGLILPPGILQGPRFGCINVHASLLPRWRGAAPIAHAILAGDNETGVSIMQMDAGLDTGPVYKMIRCQINNDDTYQVLHDRLAKLGAEALLMTLQDLQAGRAKPQPQNNANACYAPKLDKHQAIINWSLPAVTITRQVRAFNPWPVAYSLIGETIVRVWQAIAIDAVSDAMPGTILQATADGIDVITGNGVLRLLQLQLPGGKPLAVADILHARQSVFAPGQRFQSAVK